MTLVSEILLQERSRIRTVHITEVSSKKCYLFAILYFVFGGYQYVLRELNRKVNAILSTVQCTCVNKLQQDVLYSGYNSECTVLIRSEAYTSFM